MDGTLHHDIPIVQCPFRGQKIGIPTLRECLRACPELRLIFMMTKLEELYGKQNVRILCTAMGVECELLPEGAGE